MITAGVGHSTHLDLEEAAREASSMALERMGTPKVDFVLCFATTEFASHYPLLFRTLKKYTGTSRILGCSAMAVLTDQGEFEGTPGLALLTLASDELDLNPFLVEEDSSATGRVEEAWKEHLRPGAMKNPLLLLLTDIFSIRPPELLDTLKREVGYIPTVGAAASGHPEDRAAFQWACSRDTNHGIAGVLFSGPIRHNTRVSQGCEPIGEPYLITWAEGRVIRQIGGRSACYMLQQALASFPPGEVERASKGVFAGILYDEQKDPPQRGDYLIRSIESIDPESGTITIVENVRPGQTLQFQVRNPSTAREELRNGVREIAQACGPDTPLFALYFESLGRGGRFHKEPDHDVNIIKEGLGELPIIGFLSNAEFAPRGSRNLVHNFSAALTVICSRGRQRVDRQSTEGSEDSEESEGHALDGVAYGQARSQPSAYDVKPRFDDHSSQAMSGT